MQSIRVIDSHTGGEPTRVVLAGGPPLQGRTLAEQREHFHREFDELRSAVVNEPRGSDPMVGALLVPPADPSCQAGVIFFNNVGMLNMCGHGTVGVVETLRFLGRLQPGELRLDTPVGPVSCWLNQDGSVTLRNVASFRAQKHVRLGIAGEGEIVGDVAWGGNWFFLVQDCREELRLSNLDRLSDLTWKIRQELQRQGITGADGGEIDHIELFGPPVDPRNHGRNFVLCPGRAYDRSSCGTGTSAKLACLHADGKLPPGAVWRQESIIGSVMEGRVEVQDGQLFPLITARAYITGQAELLLDDHDPFRHGIRA